MGKEEINIGDYVKNKLSGKFGFVRRITPDQRYLEVMTIQRTSITWNRANVELIKAATR